MQTRHSGLDPVAHCHNFGFSAKALRDIEKTVIDNQTQPMELGMSFSQLKPGEQIKNVSFTEDSLSADLLDGRTILVPLAWYPRLLHATIEQRRNRQVCGGGFGIHWPELEEDLSTEGLLRGAPAPKSTISDVA